jgi:DNA-binding HxlR family transcriptional regulator
MCSKGLRLTAMDRPVPNAVPNKPEASLTKPEASLTGVKARKARWRDKNRAAYNEKQRELMRRKRAAQ